MKGIPTTKIVIGGFSQGAMVSYYTAFQLDFQLGGVIALSGYLPLFKTFDKKFNEKTKEVPLFIGIIYKE